jgi:hypothetical protein
VSKAYKAQLEFRELPASKAQLVFKERQVRSVYKDLWVLLVCRVTLEYKEKLVFKVQPVFSESTVQPV